MVPVLIEGQRYVLTYRFSQDHLELLFNSIRASGRVHKFYLPTAILGDIPALVHDHSYLPVRFDGLVDNALVYISGKTI